MHVKQVVTKKKNIKLEDDWHVKQAAIKVNDEATPNARIVLA